MADGTVPAIEARGLGRTWRRLLARRGTVALRGVDLRVDGGEVFGLLGPNGSGKTTLLRILAGVLLPSAGEARVLGEDPRRPSARAALGYLPEEGSLFPFLTVEETLEFFGRLHGLGAGSRRARAAVLIERFDLGAVRRRRVSTLSRGMHRRLQVCRVLLHSPRVLLLDEPGAGLDPMGMEALLGVLREHAASGGAALLSSHHPGELADVCSRVGMLLEGRIAREGAPGEILAERDRVVWEIAGLDAGARAEVRRGLEARGGGVRERPSVPPPSRLYRREGEP